MLADGLLGQPRCPGVHAFVARLDRRLFIFQCGIHNAAASRRRAGPVRARGTAPPPRGVPVARAERVSVVRILREGVAARPDEQLGALRDIERHDRVVQVGCCIH